MIITKICYFKLESYIKCDGIYTVNTCKDRHDCQCKYTIVNMWDMISLIVLTQILSRSSTGHRQVVELLCKRYDIFFRAYCLWSIAQARMFRGRSYSVKILSARSVKGEDSSKQRKKARSLQRKLDIFKLLKRKQHLFFSFLQRSDRP